MTFTTAVHSENVLCFSHPFFTIIELKALNLALNLKPSKLRIQSLLDHLFLYLFPWFDSCIPFRRKRGLTEPRLRKNRIFRRLKLCSRQPIVVNRYRLEVGLTACCTAAEVRVPVARSLSGFIGPGICHI